MSIKKSTVLFNIEQLRLEQPRLIPQEVALILINHLLDYIADDDVREAADDIVL